MSLELIAESVIFCVIFQPHIVGLGIDGKSQMEARVVRGGS